jgi:N-acyl-D-amino-acid deacylase
MTLLIKDVRVLGGARSFPDRSDVFVSNERISAIGSFPQKSADVVLEGGGAYLSPGFIDVNTDSDHYLTLFDHPEQEDFLRQGVTTILGGMCGSSLAPLLYGSLESFEKWSDTDRVNVSWHTMQEFLAVLEKRPLAVNFGTLAGHSTVRRAIIGDATRDLTRNELNVFVSTLKGALQEGSFGFSTGLAYVHERNTSYAELRTLVDLTKKYNGVYATHLRHPGAGIASSVAETVKLAKETGAKTVISHFVPVIGAEKEYEEALSLIESLPPEIDLHFDIYPSDQTLLPLYMFLPQWGQMGNVDVMLANLKDEWITTRIKKEMPRWDEKNFVIAHAPRNDFLVGKTLADLKAMYGLHDGRDALIRLMIMTSMRGGILYKNLSGALTRRAIVSPRSFIASNAPSFSEWTFRSRQLKSERTTRTFTDFLDMVRQKNVMSLEAAIAKITAAPAKEYNLAGRGVIAEGNFADLACFKDGVILFTVVNGKVAMNNGVFGGVFPGKALRHSART